jgi:hypothetical protein
MNKARQLLNLIAETSDAEKRADAAIKKSKSNYNKLSDTDKKSLEIARKKTSDLYHVAQKSANKWPDYKDALDAEKELRAKFKLGPHLIGEDETDSVVQDLKAKIKSLEMQLLHAEDDNRHGEAERIYKEIVATRQKIVKHNQDKRKK